MRSELFTESPTTEAGRLNPCELGRHFVHRFGACQAGDDLWIGEAVDDHLAHSAQDTTPHLRQPEAGHVLDDEPYPCSGLPHPLDQANGSGCPIGHPGKLVNDDEYRARAVTTHRGPVHEVFDDPAGRYDALHRVARVAEVDVYQPGVVIGGLAVQQSADCCADSLVAEANACDVLG